MGAQRCESGGYSPKPQKRTGGSEQQTIHAYSFKNFEPICDFEVIRNLMEYPDGKELFGLDGKTNADLLGIFLSKYDILKKEDATFNDDLALIGEHFDIVVAPKEAGYSCPPVTLVINAGDIAAKNSDTLQRFEHGMEELSKCTDLTRAVYAHKEDVPRLDIAA